MKKTLATMAATAVLMASTVLAPAFAQTNNTAPASPAAPAAPSDPAASTPAPATPSAGSDMSSAAGGSYLTEQSDTQVSANDYIGKAIYNADNESIGDVNDLIMEEKGGIVAAVVGVGGFLGIGEKDVAVPMDKITMSRDAEKNEVRLTTTETAEALQAAPEFKTLDDQQAATDATTTSSTTGAAPAAPAATPAAPATGGDTNSSTVPKQ